MVLFILLPINRELCIVKEGASGLTAVDVHLTLHKIMSPSSAWLPRRA
jgi:hypothetical protein